MVVSVMVVSINLDQLSAVEIVPVENIYCGHPGSNLFTSEQNIDQQRFIKKEGGCPHLH